MPSIKDLEMAAAVSAYQHIEIKKSWFGLSQKAVYVPTQSPVKVIVNEYAPADGERLERLLDMPLDKLESELKGKSVPKPVPIGHFRLEACLSDDRQFCALQLLRFVDFKYSPAFEPRFYSGKDAETVAQLL